MLACYSAIVSRVLLAVAGAILAVAPRSVINHATIEFPSVAVAAAAPADTTKPPREAKPEKPESAEKPAGEKSDHVKITITGEGIKIDSEDGERVLFELDAKELLEDLEDFDLEGLEYLDDLPEVIAEKLRDIDDRQFDIVRGSDQIRFGDDIVVRRNELVRGDVVAILGDVSVEGKVMGSVVSIFGDIDLSSSSIVNGEVVSVLGRVEKERGARVRGETVSVATGRPYFNLPLFRFHENTLPIASRILLLIVSLLLFGVVVAFLRDRMDRSSSFVIGSFFKSLGIGALVLFVGSIMVAVVAAIFSITIIGIPVAILLVLSYVALCVLGYFVSALALGRWIGGRFNLETSSPFLLGFLGLFLLALLGLVATLMRFIPFLGALRGILSVLGFLVNITALVVGIGSFLLSKAGNRSMERKTETPA